MNAPSSLMTSRSCANELPGPAAVRPAMVTSSWNPPCTAMSQCAMPLGPQADQVMIASSTSVSGTTGPLEVNANGPGSWRMLRPVALRCSSCPLSIEYPCATRRLRSVESSCGSGRVCSKYRRSWRLSSSLTGGDPGVRVVTDMTASSRPRGLSLDSRLSACLHPHAGPPANVKGETGSGAGPALLPGADHPESQSRVQVAEFLRAVPGAGLVPAGQVDGEREDRERRGRRVGHLELAGGDPALDHLPEDALDRQPHRRHGTEVGRLQGGQLVLGHPRRGVVTRVPGGERGYGRPQLPGRIPGAGWLWG